MSSDDYEDFDDSAADEAEGGEDSGESMEAAEEAPASAEEGRHLSEAEEAEQLTVSAKDTLRKQLEEEMERFLTSGGKIQEIPPDVSADPPRKPESSYGSKPI